MAQMTTADCGAINTAIVRETGRIGPEIYNRVVRSTPWIAMTPRDTFPDGMGVIQTNMMFERILPSNSSNEVWADVNPSDGTSNNCLPPTEILQWGQTLRTWRMQKIAKQTEEFCIEDLRTAFDMQKVMTMYVNGLQRVSQWVWENRDRNEYTALAMHKVTEGPAATYNINATTFNAATPPTSYLTNGTLEQIYSQLIREGAGADAMGNNTGGAPVFGLMTDENTSRHLIRQDPELRSDFRFAFEGKGDGSPLLTPFFGTPLSYDGYKHMMDFFPARWEIVGGAYVRISPFTSPLATTQGVKRDLNPAYIYATFQDSVVHVPSVFTQRIPQPLTGVSKIKFDPVNYMGEFSWKNILDKICNPDGTIGFFRAIFASASEPVHPEFGYVIRHLNCAALRTGRNCYETSVSFT